MSFKASPMPNQPRMSAWPSHLCCCRFNSLQHNCGFRPRGAPNRVKTLSHLSQESPTPEQKLRPEARKSPFVASPVGYMASCILAEAIRHFSQHGTPACARSQFGFAIRVRASAPPEPELPPALDGAHCKRNWRLVLFLGDI